MERAGCCEGVSKALVINDNASDWWAELLYDTPSPIGEWFAWPELERRVFSISSYKHSQARWQPRHQGLEDVRVWFWLADFIGAIFDACDHPPVMLLLCPSKVRLGST